VSGLANTKRQRGFSNTKGYGNTFKIKENKP